MLKLIAFRTDYYMSFDSHLIKFCTFSFFFNKIDIIIFFNKTILYSLINSHYI